MARTARELLDELMALPSVEREIIAVQLLDSLEEEEPDAVEKAWIDEVRRRIAQIDAGEVTCRPADEVIAEMRARFT